MSGGGTDALEERRKIEAVLALETLRLEGMGIAVLENLECFTRCRSLYLRGNCISKIENLDVLPHLTFVDLSHNSVQSLGTHLKDLSSLKVLDVSHNLIEVCDPDTQLPPRLQFLCLHNNPVQDKDPHLRHNIITYLAWLVSLDEVEITLEERQYLGAPIVPSLYATEAPPHVTVGHDQHAAQNMRPQSARRISTMVSQSIESLRSSLSLPSRNPSDEGAGRQQQPRSMREVREDIQRMQDYLVARKLPLLEELDEWKCNMRDLTRSAVQRMEAGKHRTMEMLDSLCQQKRAENHSSPPAPS